MFSATKVTVDYFCVVHLRSCLYLFALYEGNLSDESTIGPVLSTLTKIAINELKLRKTRGKARTSMIGCMFDCLIYDSILNFCNSLMLNIN